MPSGTVKWFDDDKGYGFIKQENGDDAFVHHSDLNQEGYASLNEGDQVEFETESSEDGLKATNVEVTSSADGSMAEELEGVGPDSL